MAVEVAGAFFQWSHPPPLPPNTSTSTSQSMASVFSSLSSSARRGNAASDHAILHGHRSPFLRSRSLDIISTGGGRISRKVHTLTRAISVDGLFSNTDDGEDDESSFVNRLHQGLNNTDVSTDSRNRNHKLPILSNRNHRAQDASPSFSLSSQPPWPAIRPDPPELPDLVPAIVERNANSVDLPLSLRMIKRRKKTSSPEATAAATATETPVKKAFSSMVFIIGELQRCTIQMRELLFVENLDGILARVHQEMHASFVWLFQQIFSCTPTLMLSLMLILASFTVNSMSFAAAAAAAAPPASVMTAAVEDRRLDFDPSAVKSFSVEAGRTASVGGADGGGGKAIPVAGGTDDWRSGGGVSSSSFHGCTINSPDLVTTLVEDEEEAILWNMIVEEASRMQAALRDDALMDAEILQRLVSPVTVDLDQENQAEYLQTELTYHRAIAQDPNNALLLCNFAQFLYLVLHDLDRAEYYFKRAVETETEPVDAEALSKYANFLWQGKNDMDAAEETYLEAIAVDPSNSFYAGNYAHFLWSTGGEDTCFPLD